MRAHPGVRLLLGVAAARSGDEARAAACVTGVEDPRAAEVLALVARSALARGDADAAALRLRDAEAADPGYPDLRALGEELSKLRQEQRAPDEAELATLISAGRAAEALAKAEAILARWPESEVARRAARSLEAQRQADEGRRLLTEADALHARGDTASALGLYQRALSVKLGDEDLGRARRMVERIVAEEREREAARRAERVAASVGAADKQERARGLAAYAELDEGIRGRVRARAGAPVLEWVDAMIRAGVRPKATLDAALALERAAAMPPAEAAAVLALLAPHNRAIEGVPFARRLAGEARERVASERRRHALADLQAAEEALAAGEAERSRGLLNRAVRELDHTHPEDRARADALSAHLAAHAEQHQLEKRFERARATFRWAEAKRTAEALAVSVSHSGGQPGAPSDGPARAHWAEVARTLMDDVRRELRLRIYDCDGGTENLARRVHDHLPAHHPRVRRSAQGGVPLARRRRAGAVHPGVLARDGPARPLRAPLLPRVARRALARGLGRHPHDDGGRERRARASPSPRWIPSGSPDSGIRATWSGASPARRAPPPAGASSG